MRVPVGRRVTSKDLAGIDYPGIREELARIEIARNIISKVVGFGLVMIMVELDDERASGPRLPDVVYLFAHIIIVGPRALVVDLALRDPEGLPEGEKLGVFLRKVDGPHMIRTVVYGYDVNDVVARIEGVVGPKAFVVTKVP